MNSAMDEILWLFKPPQKNIKSDWLQKELIRKAKEKRERILSRNRRVNMEQILKDVR